MQSKANLLKDENDEKRHFIILQMSLLMPGCMFTPRTQVQSDDFDGNYKSLEISE